MHVALYLILDLHVGGGVQKNILSILLWAPAVLGELHCLVASQELKKPLNIVNFSQNNQFLIENE